MPFSVPYLKSIAHSVRPVASVSRMTVILIPCPAAERGGDCVGRNARCAGLRCARVSLSTRARVSRPRTCRHLRCARVSRPRTCFPTEGLLVASPSPHLGDLRSAVSARSGDLRRALLWLSCLKHRAYKPEAQAKESHYLPSLALQA